MKIIPLLAAGLLALGACADNPASSSGEAKSLVAVRFGVNGASSLQGAAQTSGTDRLVLTGANGTLAIDDLRLVVARFRLKGDDDRSTCTGDDCDDFNAGPMFIDLPLGPTATPVASGTLPAGIYRRVDFRVRDLDDDEENPVERAAIDSLRARILSQFADWPRQASMLVVGTFTPTGGTAVPFRAYLRTRFDVRLELSPSLVVDGTASRGVDVLVDPARLFRSGANVLNLSQASGLRVAEDQADDSFSGRGGRGSD
ncbi:MAG TPA: hypothetical protein VF665_11515 [Longimicrobium sp.]|jgi:hypothetical protein|uniref:hypothetical protein n=1 Tax=Longimicrobium sp. TaxID=2029185 RepID=UPI002EDAE04C